MHELLAIACAWIMLGALGLARPAGTDWATRALYPAGAVLSLLLAAVALGAIFAPPEALVLPLGLLTGVTFLGRVLRVGFGHGTPPAGEDYSVPYNLSPKSPRPGTMYLCSFNPRSTTGV